MSSNDVKHYEGVLQGIYASGITVILMRSQDTTRRLPSLASDYTRNADMTDCWHFYKSLVLRLSSTLGSAKSKAARPRVTVWPSGRTGRASGKVEIPKGQGGTGDGMAEATEELPFLGPCDIRETVDAEGCETEMTSPARSMFVL